jgi:hypothetical protein
VRGAHQVASIGTEELIVYPVEGNSGVRTPIDVSEVIAFEVHEQRLEIPLASAQNEFFAFTVFDLAHERNKFSR